MIERFNRLNDFRWIPMALLFCVMFSSCRTAKTKTTKQTMVETGRALSLQTEQKNYAEAQNENVTENKNERQTKEVVTAIFDTLDSKPILKKLRIERTVADRAVHAEQQVESHASGTEVKAERYKVKGEGEMEIHSEKKSKTEPSRAGWWMAAGAVIVLLLLFWVRKRILNI